MSISQKRRLFQKKKTDFSELPARVRLSSFQHPILIHLVFVPQYRFSICTCRFNNYCMIGFRDRLLIYEL